MTPLCDLPSRGCSAPAEVSLKPHSTPLARRVPWHRGKVSPENVTGSPPATCVFVIQVVRSFALAHYCLFKKNLLEVKQVAFPIVKGGCRCLCLPSCPLSENKDPLIFFFPIWVPDKLLSWIRTPWCARLIQDTLGCEATQGPQPLPSWPVFCCSQHLHSKPGWFRPRLPSICISHQMPLITALNVRALNNSH